MAKMTGVIEYKFASSDFLTHHLSSPRGYNWRSAMPDGYGLSSVGVAVFLTGGLRDMLWHTLQSAIILPQTADEGGE